MSDSGSLTLTATRAKAGLDARRGIVRLHPEALTALGLRAGDAVAIAGRRSTAAIALAADRYASRRALYADDLTLGNIGARDGDPVRIAPVALAAADRVVLSGPASAVAVVDPDTLRLALLSKVVGEGDDVSLLPIELGDAQRELVSATRRTLNNTLGIGWTTMVLNVVEASPASAAMITSDTRVEWESDAPASIGSPLESGRVANPGRARAPMPAAYPGGEAAQVRPRAEPREPVRAQPEAQPGIAPIPYEELAGAKIPAEELRELLDLGFNHREVLKVVGTDMTLGVLVSGPSGAGKATVTRSVAAAVGARVSEVSGHDLAALEANAAADRLRAAVASLTVPGVLLVRGVEAIAPAGKRTPLGTMFTRLVDEVLAEPGEHAVVCTTARIEDVDTVLRSKLEHEVVVPMPDADARRDLLVYLTRGMKVAEDVKLENVAHRAPGYVASDLAVMVREAGVRAAMRAKDGGATALQGADFDGALDSVRPTSMSGDAVELGGLTLADVGGMEELKQTLTETVLWPLTYPDAFTRLGIEAPRGILLYGPPGCGKTYIVRAVAGEGHANVLSVKGSELLNKWVGESEKNVRELFRRARQASPTLMFFDELDALAPVRGGGTDGGTADRVVAALLTELDGAESLRDVVVVGATNRPDMIDPALLRPGRLERLVYVPPPDAVGRADILRANAKNVPFADDVDLGEVADELWLYSAADCAALVREAALTAMRESLDASIVTASHVAQAMERVRPSLDPEQLEYLEHYARNREA
ncbi:MULTISPECIES: AAA family ATPase [Glycomyces]|uniref:AAA family ATPase n=2 Tax=Glycomyces TaxID=58113 RepID=A0A9X3PRG2_9ACTN|nr:AAA family ATPase [Glycomyces lechevalierae]MDA1384158.1 AAA family ATPase [Glycomyces lechevalierae]MDR7339412.1 transitional endoplasmic reticulum ATPase [Glycomyces lechevalierae]